MFILFFYLQKERNYIKYVGIFYLLFLPLQLLLQMIFLFYVNNEFKKNGVGPLHEAVWIVFAVYSALNVSKQATNGYWWVW